MVAHAEQFAVSGRLWELHVSVSSFEIQVHFRNPKREIHCEKMGKYHETGLQKSTFSRKNRNPKSVFVAAIETEDVFLVSASD